MTVLSALEYPLQSFGHLTQTSLYQVLTCKFGIDIWFKTGIKTNTRFIPVHSISQSIGHEISLCLISFHALTGCDSTSCLKEIGKKKAFKVLKRKVKDFSELKELGDKLELPNALIRTCESFICQLSVGYMSQIQRVMILIR